MTVSPPRNSLLRELAERCRIRPSFIDNDGVERVAPDDTLRTIVAAMGYQCEDDGQILGSLARITAESWDTLAEPIALVTEGSREVTLELRVPAQLTAIEYSWSLTSEDSTAQDGSSTLSFAASDDPDNSHRIVKLTLDLALPLGYHDMSLTAEHGKWKRKVKIRLIVFPPHCYIPDELRDGKDPTVVLNVQLNSVTSGTNFGTGDLLDIEEIAGDVAPLGVGAIGLSPLHPPQPDCGPPFSPYLATSRGVTDPVRINVLRAARRLGATRLAADIESGALSRQVEELRASRIVHLLTGQTVFGALNQLWDEFKEVHSNPATEQWAEFQRFIAFRGRRLRHYATFAALREVLILDDPANGSFRNWPAHYRDPNSAEVHAFAEAHEDRILLYQFLEWVARHDVASLQRRCKDLGMRIGAYFDLAMSADSGGAENWMDPDLVVSQVTIGFPPDALGPQGQNIGSPPTNPFRVRQAFYDLWIELLRYNMDGAGAVRVDHGPQINQLLWIPLGRTPAEGAYVRSFMDEVVAILCLESHRAKCMVILEDLGTVPEEVRVEMSKRSALSYRVQRFERRWGTDKRHIPPRDYPKAAIAVVTTHDLALVRSNWSMADVVLRADLGLDTPEAHDGFRAARKEEKLDLMQLMADEGIIVNGDADGLLATSELPEPVLLGCHRLLRHTPCMLLGIELGDANGLEVPYNVPGTGDEVRRNWRTKQPIPREKYLSAGRLPAILAAMRS